MKKFKYRVESYLKFLKFQREEALKKVKATEEFRDKLIQRYNWMEGEMKKAYEVNSKVGREGKNIHYINDNNQFLRMLKVHMENLSNENCYGRRRVQG